jgi:hypothetical protein
MSLVETSIAILISVVLTVAGLVGAKAVMHSGKIQALESAIHSVEQLSLQYGNMNSGFNGLSCTGLQYDSLEPAGACNGENFTSVLNMGNLQVAPTNLSSCSRPNNCSSFFTITFTPTDPSITQADCAGPLTGSMSSGASITCNPGSWSIGVGPGNKP